MFLLCTETGPTLVIACLLKKKEYIKKDQFYLDEEGMNYA